MASTITPPSDELNQIIRGDLDIIDAYDTTNGTGTIHIRNGGLYVEGLTDLDQTTITTNDGKFHVLGTEKVEFNVSGGATSTIEMTAEDTSFFTTTAGELTLSATATDANGKITIQAAGTGTDSILINATNAVSGQINISSAGADTSTDAVVIQATDTTDGNILIQGSGNFAATNPAVKILADNSTSGQILLESAGDSASSDAISLSATASTGGTIALTAAGSTSSAILLDATNATSGEILVRSAGGDASGNAIKLLASDTADGNILVQASGTNTNSAPIHLLADNSTSGQITLESDGNLAGAITISATNATGGGIDIDAVGGGISIDTQDTTAGITIATGTAGVPVTIGTPVSITTIAGELIVGGAASRINAETLTVEDNFIYLNSGNGELGLDSGITIRRFQDPNAAGTGNVVNGATPIQESGVFQAGSATPGTLVLADHASATDDFYNGWWIKITSGTGVNQVRRIIDYVGSTQTATVFVTADNSDTVIDGLDLVTAPAAADTYELYSDSFASTFYDESDDTWTFANTSQVPDPVSSGGTSVAAIQQYQQVHTGEIDVHSQIYNNVSGSASGTTITVTLRGHGLAVADPVGISNSSGFTSELTTGKYIVATVADANTFTFTADAATTNAAGSSMTVNIFYSSVIKVNNIEPHDSEIGAINIIGLSCIEDISIPKTSTAFFSVSNCTTTYGALLILIKDLNNTDGAFSVFVGARSSSSNNGTLSRVAAAKGADGQRIDADWLDGESVKIRQAPAGSGAGNYTYRVRVFVA